VVVRLTGHQELGQVLGIVLGAPLRLLSIVLAGVLVRAVLHRFIDRLAERVTSGGPAESDTPEAGSADAGPDGSGNGDAGPDGSGNGDAGPDGSGNGDAGTTASGSGNGAAERRRLLLQLSTRRRLRARTLASVLRSLTTAVIAVVVGLMGIQELGYSVGPLLASAGVVGVALAFGSQSLVRDVVSGIFMIVEDQYGVGDLIEVGQTTGTVEAVGLRVTRLRAEDGTVWYLRNGEILVVGNRSQ
jgi:small conductance mechanosensitive channel